MAVDLSRYENRKYCVGAGKVKRAIWYVVNAGMFNSRLFPFYRVKCLVLRWFGAQIGYGVIIKPRVNVKYPWYLTVGNHVWIGENVWIDNLARVTIGSHVCISQDAYLLTGNHDYNDPTFALITREIVLDDGVWVAARAIVCPGVRMGPGAILAVGSVLSKDAQSNWIYRGNPAERVRMRR